MKTDLLMLAPLLEEYEAQLADHFNLVCAYTPDDQRQAIAKDPQRFSALVTSGGQGVPAFVLEQLPALKLIAVNGVGVDKIDMDRTRERGIEVVVTANVLTDAVADLAVGMTLTLLRQICVADRFVRAGHWQRGAYSHLGLSVRGLRVGILGLGQIGKAIAERLEPFGASLSYHNRRPVETSPYAYFDSLEALAANSDILIVAAAGGAASRHLVSAAVLDALGPDGMLVNVARGTVVDEKALTERLVDGRLAGAALDVFEDEPQVPAALLDLENVVLQPHLGSATLQTRRAMAQIVVDAVMSGAR